MFCCNVYTRIQYRVLVFIPHQKNINMDKILKRKSIEEDNIKQKRIKCRESDKDNSKKRKHKKKKSSSSSSTSSSSSDSSSTDSEEERRRIEKKKLKKKLKKEKKKAKKGNRKCSDKTEDVNTDIPLNLMDKCTNRAPITKEEWEKQQSVVRRVYDETTGRHRLIKGDGEVIEEIVSRDRHKAINQQATKGDGEFFQNQLAKLKK
ncbi:unnamed protein product [Brassicogethes aeneus]|uniref:ADP-ribosylation factor-like protein 6-interacting protein 4 n=1 Tax=Brassicogethes aeneus TaxID=1431903 RepID=A0A9P0B1T1_BRAAE|nr:unnamed protein product [Brassicogethes aeneus]